MGFLAEPRVSQWLDDGCQRPVPAWRVESFLFRDAFAVWAIEVEGRIAGVAGFSDPDLARGIAREFIVLGNPLLWGQGLGRAVLTNVIELGFHRLGLRKINADCLAPNQAALTIHRHAGFHEEGRLRADAWRNGAWVDRVLFSVLREDGKTPDAVR